MLGTGALSLHDAAQLHREEADSPTARSSIDAAILGMVMRTTWHGGKGDEERSMDV